MRRGQALAAVIVIHLAISIVHGSAHTSAEVPLPRAGTLFVYIVILAGPLSNREARTELGWQPSFPSIREGLIRTLPQSGVSVLQ